jgi:hypothetical protein
MIVVLGLVFVISILSISLTRAIVTFMRTTYQVEQANAAYFAAEAGVEMALYDLLAYDDGYETTKVSGLEAVCGAGVDTGAVGNFDQKCDDGEPYRFVNFSDAIKFSGARGFWRLFSRTIDSSGTDLVPNPYFAGDKNGIIETSEWGRLNRARSLSLSLLRDENPLAPALQPENRYLRLGSGDGEQIIFMLDPAEEANYDTNKCVDLDLNGVCDNVAFGSENEEEILTWTLSALDTSGDEYALQGVAWESDFIVQDCDGGGQRAKERCFILDFSKDNADVSSNINADDGHVLAGEDINRNITNLPSGVRLNRVSGVKENFDFATPKSFIDDLNSLNPAIVDGKNIWQSARLTVNLIAAISDTSGIASNSLRYKLISNEQWSDEFTYIVSQGFAGRVKQTIETSFRRSTTLPVFTYAIFQ